MILVFFPMSCLHAKRTMCTVKYAGSLAKRDFDEYIASRPRTGDRFSISVSSDWKTNQSWR